MKKHFALPILITLLLGLALLCSCGGKGEPSIPDYTSWGDICVWADRAEDARGDGAVRWQEDGGDAYTLFLPSDMHEFYIWFDGADAVKIDGAGVRSGDLCAIADGEHTLTAGADGGYETTFTVRRSLGTASVIITTSSGSLDAVNESADHSLTESGSVCIASDKGELVYSGELAEIRGRGNSSWLYEKKPYQLKLPVKTALFDMDASKTWILLSQHNDPTLIRNAFYFDLARDAGIEFTPEYAFCDVWADGEYLGSYLLCEKVSVGEGRVEITDLEKLNGDRDPAIAQAQYAQEDGMRYCTSEAAPADISGGYLLEFDYSYRWKEESCGFVTNKGLYVVIKSPSDATRAEVEYIRNIVCAAEDALYAADGMSGGRSYNELIDVDGLCAMQLIDELSTRLDAGKSSFYMYKETDRRGDGKLHFAPVWDFDSSCENTLSSASFPQDWWWTSGMTAENREPLWYAAALAQQDYRDRLRAVWEERFAPLLDGYKEKIKSLSEKISASAEMNFSLWDIGSLPVTYDPFCGKGSPSDYAGAFADGLAKRISLLESDTAQDGFDGVSHPAFCDVGDDARTADSVEFVCSQGWFAGTEPYLFEPAKPMTRGMLAVTLTRAAGVTPEKPQAQVFDDTAPDSWYAPAAAWCAEAGLVEAGGSFGGELPLDAQYMCDILTRFAARLGVGAPAAPADPSSAVTRADCAVALYEMLG